MKKTLGIIATLLLFIALPLSLYQTYLLYMHVHATELMWFVWIISIPISILLSIVGHLLKSVATDKGENL